MRKTLLVFIFFFGISSVFGQTTFSISGSVLDDQNKPVSIGDVLVLQPEKENLIKYTTVLEGQFLIEDIPKGKYRLKISCLGFETMEKVLELNKNLSLKLVTKEETTSLDEVSVVAAKPIVTNKNGNLKVDITNPIFSTIPDPIDLLGKLPNVQVSSDRESINIIGKGVPLIYIGNQRISIQEFQAISLDEIASIEIIRNPSAKYEANGSAVLLITRKKEDSDGYRLNFSETASLKRNFNNYTNFNGSFKTGKLTVKGNFAYNDLLQWESHQFEFDIPEANIFSDYLILVDKNDRVELNSGGGLFYQINDVDYFSANITHRLQTNDAGIDTKTFLRQGINEDNIVTETDNENTKDFISTNLNYNKAINAKTNIFAGIQYSFYVQHLNTDIANNFNSNGFNNAQIRSQRYRINALALKLDVERKLENDFKYQYGVNSSNTRANALTDIQFLETNTVLDVNYDYLENTIAAYTSLSGKLGEKLNFNVGVRVENNVVKGEDEESTIPLVERHITNLFPRANFTFKIDSTKNITFNYTKTIVRPNYSNTSSIQVFFNPFLEGEGNVNLLPTLNEEVSATYQFAESSISIAYTHSKNPIYYTINYVSSDNRAVFSLKNFEKESGINVNYTMPVTKGVWTSTNTVSLSTRKIQDAIAISESVKPYLYIYTDHQFKIAKETTLSFGGWGLTKRSEGIFERDPMFVFNTTIATTFFKKLQCVLRFNDISKAMNFKEIYAINGVIADGVYFVDAQEIAFSMKYTFGKSKAPTYKNKNTDENLNRIR